MNSKITYHKEGDYLIPNLYIKNYKKNDYHIGKYGRLRLKYLKEHNRGLYTELLLDGKLDKHLALIDEDANKRLNDIIRKLAFEDIDKAMEKILYNTLTYPPAFHLKLY